nr:hypothetical protein [uncultured Mediterranean phage uvMED]
MVPIVVGDGVMAQREKNGLCPKCQAFWKKGQTQCRVCDLVILTAEDRPQKPLPLDQRPDLSP